MKTNPASLTARVTIGALFLIIGVALVVLALSATGLRSATPTAGTLNPTGPTVTWAGTAAGGGSLDESTCVEGVNCDTYILTLSGTPTAWTGLKARIVISSPDPTGLTDYDLYVHKGTNSGPIVPNGTSANSGTPRKLSILTQTIRIPAPASFLCTWFILVPVQAFNIPAAPAQYLHRPRRH